MPAKKKRTSKKKVEKPVETVETPVETVVEEEIKVEEVIEKKNTRLEWWIKWKWTVTTVKQPIRTIRFEAKVAPVPMFKLPDDIRRYLINKWWDSSVWRKDKEWLERNWANMEMIEKLKQFLSGLDY